MITVWLYEKQHARRASWSEISGAHERCFIDCLKPTEDELNRISELTKIPLEEIHEAIDLAERPRTAEYEEFSLLVFRAPYSHKKGTATTPVALFLNTNCVIAIRHTELTTFKKIDQMDPEKRNQLFKPGAGYLVFWIIDTILSSFFSFMESLGDRIDTLEVKIYENPQEAQIKEIFYLKKVMIFFHKALTANREVISAIEKEYLRHIHKKDLKLFRNTYNDVVELLDLESTYRDILTGAMDIYLTSVSNNLNIIMKKMTALGSFILIPTLIAGIYGMNFSVMPELTWKYGYPFSLGLMVLSVVLLFIFFKRKAWI